MKKFFAYSLISSSLFLGSFSSNAEDFWGVQFRQPNNEIGFQEGDGYRFFSVNSETGESNFETSLCDQFQYQVGNSQYYVCQQGTISINESNGYLEVRDKSQENNTDNFHKYNINTKKWFLSDKWTTDYDTTIKKPVVIKDDNGNTKLTVSGKKLVERKENGELHIGENSWITKEENGRQKVWAKDAAGNSIPIDYTNGTKLLINGRDIEQSINNVGALSAALTGLPTVPTDTTLACGLGAGTHGGDFAFSGGCASEFNEKLSINYAASMTMPGQDYAGNFDDQFSARAGFIWKLGKSNNPTQISMKEKKELKKEISDLKENNKNIIAQNKALLERLERLEKIALDTSKSKDLATIKLP